MPREQGSLCHCQLEPLDTMGRQRRRGQALGLREQVFLLTVPNPVRLGGGVNELIPREDILSHQHCTSPQASSHCLSRKVEREGQSSQPPVPGPPRALCFSTKLTLRPAGHSSPADGVVKVSFICIHLPKASDHTTIHSSNDSWKETVDALGSKQRKRCKSQHILNEHLLSGVRGEREGLLVPPRPHKAHGDPWSRNWVKQEMACNSEFPSRCTLQRQKQDPKREGRLMN